MILRGFSKYNNKHIELQFFWVRSTFLQKLMFLQLKKSPFFITLLNFTYVILTSTLKALVNNSLYESFDSIFMKMKKKNYQNINYFFFSFLIKTFFKWIIN